MLMLTLASCVKVYHVEVEMPVRATLVRLVRLVRLSLARSGLMIGSKARLSFRQNQSLSMLKVLALCTMQ